MTSNNLRLLGLLTAILAVGSGAVLGIRLLHKPKTPPPVPKPQEMRVTSIIQASFDGSNWFTLTNLSYQPVAVKNLAGFDMARNIRYIKTVNQ